MAHTHTHTRSNHTCNTHTTRLASTCCIQIQLYLGHLQATWRLPRPIALWMAPAFSCAAVDANSWSCEGSNKRCFGAMLARKDAESTIRTIELQKKLAQISIHATTCWNAKVDACQHVLTENSVLQFASWHQLHYALVIIYWSLDVFREQAQLLVQILWFHNIIARERAEESF